MEYFPALHDRQELDPILDEYAPAGQELQLLEFVPEYSPTEQFIHGVDPLTFLKVPAGQGTHEDSERRVNPALQTHADFAEL